MGSVHLVQLKHHMKTEWGELTNEQLLNEMDDTCTGQTSAINEIQDLSLLIHKRLEETPQTDQPPQQTQSLAPAQSDQLQALQEEIKKLQKENSELREAHAEQEEDYERLSKRSTRECAFLKEQLDLAEKHIKTLEKNKIAKKPIAIQLDDDSNRRSSMPIASQSVRNLNQLNRDEEEGHSSVQALAAAQQEIVRRKNQEIVELRRKLQKFQQDEEEDSNDPDPAQPSSTDPQLLSKEVADLKNRYFYALIVGIKLSLLQQDLPVSFDANSLYEKALEVPHQEWDQWIYQQIGK